MSGAPYMFEELPWPDIEERARRCDIAVLPLASLAPWPGPLPVGCDAYIVEGLVRRGAALAMEDVGALVLPPLEFSTSAEPNLHPGRVAGFFGQYPERFVSSGFSPLRIRQCSRENRQHRGEILPC